MAQCGLLNLASCIPEKIFEYLAGILNAPINPLLNFIRGMLSEPINLNLFVGIWAIIIYVISMFYAFLLIYTGINFMVSGYDVAKRENAKTWLRNILIMVILVQASFLIYELVIELSAIITSATLTLMDNSIFLLNFDNVGDLVLNIVFIVVYLVTLLITSLVMIIRYDIVAIGIIFFPLAIFLYFIPPARQYGLLILNFLAVCIFVTFIDVIILIGFSKLVNVGILASMKILVAIAGFLLMDAVMLFLMFFTIVKSGMQIYHRITG